MDEDLELNRLVKSALEAKGSFAWDPSSQSGLRGGLDAPKGAASNFHRRLAWASAALLAASVALVATFHQPGREEPSSVEDVLRLLSEAENVSLTENGASSSAELLLAWQEAPISY